MKLLEFLLETKLYIGTIFEIIAAISGFWYLRKSNDLEPEIRYFIYYLILIVILEVYGYLPIWAWLENYEILSFYENSVFRRNLWWSNSLSIVGIIIISLVFVRSIQNESVRKAFYFTLVLFVIFSVISFFTFGEFFHANDPYSSIVGVFIVFLAVVFYYFRIFNSEEIVNFYGDIRFYISFAIVIWNLCIIPLDIYSGYFNLENPAYIELETKVRIFSNMFLYSVYAFGFYMDYRYRYRELN